MYDDTKWEHSSEVLSTNEAMRHDVNLWKSSHLYGWYSAPFMRTASFFFKYFLRSTPYVVRQIALNAVASGSAAGYSVTHYVKAGYSGNPTTPDVSSDELDELMIPEYLWDNTNRAWHCEDLMSPLQKFLWVQFKGSFLRANNGLKGPWV